jgi:hypothetical protein
MRNGAAAVGGAGVEGVHVVEGAYEGGAPSTEGELEVACDSRVLYRDSISMQETAAAGTSMESGGRGCFGGTNLRSCLGT